jgi:putative protease
MTETKIGTVTHYFGHLHVAGVAITDGELRIGDTIHIKGHTSDFQQKVESMQIEHQAVEIAKPGDQIGLLVTEHARENDTVYAVT